MSIYSDFKLLAEQDVRHERLARVSPLYLRIKKYDLHIHYDVDGTTPLTGLTIAYPSVCPIDPDADLQFKFWVADLRQSTAKLEHGYAQNCLYAYEKIKKIGAGKAWGLVPNYSTHLLAWLEKMRLASAVAKQDGKEVGKALGDDWTPRQDYEGYKFYIADPNIAETWLRSQ